MVTKKTEGDSGNSGSKTMRCRMCGQKNTVKSRYKNGAANCGKCKLPLSNEKHKKFADLTKHEYGHGEDTANHAKARVSLEVAAVHQ